VVCSTGARYLARCLDALRAQRDAPRSDVTVVSDPAIDGIEDFEGHTFHTSRWDYEYTGGDPLGAPLDKLADKRVGIIGTGATSVQCVPHLAPACQVVALTARSPQELVERLVGQTGLVDTGRPQPRDPLLGADAENALRRAKRNAGVSA
jgi:hypothetical protein